MKVRILCKKTITIKSEKDLEKFYKKLNYIEVKYLPITKIKILKSLPHRYKPILINNYFSNRKQIQKIYIMEVYYYLP